jgi:hypothetical protein
VSIWFSVGWAMNKRLIRKGLEKWLSCDIMANFHEQRFVGKGGFNFPHTWCCGLWVNQRLCS